MARVNICIDDDLKGSDRVRSFSFPDDFFWGTASSAYQTEGNNPYTDWYDLENSDQRKPARKRKITEPCGAAADHWNRYEEDYDLAAAIGVQVHRLSIDWARVFPAPDRLDEDALEHYGKMLRALRERNIKVMLCLNHFTLPRWVDARGGYGNKDFLLPRYTEYVEKVVSSLGHLVDYWLPINEPNVVPLAGYLLGMFPPFKRGLFKFATAYRNIAAMHGQSYRIIKESYPEAPVGVAFSFQHFQPYNKNSRFHKWSVSVADKAANTCFFDAIRTGKMAIPFCGEEFIPYLKDSMDFAGINYYSTLYMRGLLPVQNKKEDFVTDMGWIFYPEGLYDVLSYIGANTDVPVIVTENGIATTDEDLRIKYIEAHLEQVKRAMEAGVDIKGYMHWSLTDNFEWLHGYKMRFGLINIDYPTQKRTIKKSGHWFAKIISKHGESAEK